MITSYNPAIGDVLIVLLKDAKNKPLLTETKGTITRIFTEKETVGFNFFKIKEALTLTSEKKGQLFLNESQVDHLNEQLKQEGFKERLVTDNQVKLVVGEVLTCVNHPDSDHLHITQVNVNDDHEPLQIVCGAKNVKVGQKVIAALPGAMMPDGTVIWPGKLRGVESFGMLCSKKELGLEQTTEKKGIYVLEQTAKVGQTLPDYLAQKGK